VSGQYIPDIERYKFALWLDGFAFYKGQFVLGKTMVGEQEVSTPQYQVYAESGDEGLLKKIRSYFGVGEIYRRPEGGYDWKGELIKPMSIYCVEDIDDLHDVILPHFETNPPMANCRQQQFTIWREAVESCYRANNCGEPGDE
jgi:hypothetical protein